MRKLTDDERSYLRIIYEKGYRYIATDFNGRTYLYKNEPTKTGTEWLAEIYKIHDVFESLIDFCTAWEDEEPTKIYDLLNTGVTD